MDIEQAAMLNLYRKLESTGDVEISSWMPSLLSNSIWMFFESELSFVSSSLGWIVVQR